MTRFGKRDESLPDLMTEAALAALADAGIERPDALIVAAMNPEEFTGEGNYGSLIGTHLGLSQVPALRVETATSSGMAAVYTAFATLAAGIHRSALVVGGEKMTHLPTPRVSEIIGRSIDPHERSYGSTMPALAGLITRAAMHRRGFALKEISLVAVKNHAHGVRNPYAHFREPVTLEAVMESRLVADPLRLFHCCPISDGAAALVLTTEPGAVRIAGIGQGMDSIAVRYRWDLTTTVGGRLPVNPSGGLKARGHPLAATGVAQLVELVWQLRGLAEGRQVEARVGLAQSIGGLATNNWVTLLEARR